MTYTSEVLADAPLGYWRLGEASGTTAADSSGNSHPGTISGSPTMGTAGLVDDADTAITFDGSNDQVAIGPLTALSALAGATLECVIKATTRTGTICGVESNPYEPNSFEMRFGGSNQIQGICGDGVGRTVSTGALSTATRYHLALVFDGANNLFRIYVNGTQVATTACSATITASSNFFIGRSAQGGGFFPGIIDEVAVYTTALSPSRIAAHAAAMTPGTVAIPPFLIDLTIPAPIEPTMTVLAVPFTLGLTIPPPTPVALAGVIVVATPFLLGVTLPAPVASVPVRAPVGRMVIDPSQGWGFDIGASIEVGTKGSVTAAGSRIKKRAETYPVPTLVDGRPVS